MSIRISPDVVERARALGCVSAEIHGPSRRNLFRVTCSCGYASSSRTSRALAFEALAHHLAKVAGGQVVNGVSVPRPVGPRL